MPIHKAYLLPHSPLLIPEISKSNLSFLDKTTSAYEKVKNELISSGIETLLVISPHGLTQEKSFLINCSPEMEINFQDFGFIPKKTIIKGDVLLADQIKNSLHQELSIKSLSENNLDYGSAIPLYLLKNLEVNFKTIIILPADKLELDDHFQFGEKLGALLNNNNKKIAVIASGDLSHRLKRKSPGGYSPKGPKFDNKLIEYLSDPETTKENILKFDKKFITAAGECALKPISILLGMLHNTPWEPDILAYQTDFGIGYLSLNFQINQA